MTIRKDIRDRFGFILKKAPKKLNLGKWKGRCNKSFTKLGCRSVDQFIEDIRGR
jgi:hypothetical protein